jgi:threonine dehydrogenase-like Zn-dependent dehydrogenase
VCGSDWNTYQGKNSTIKTPAILGHEIVGIVIALGDDAPAKFTVGDRVLLEEFLPCFHCEQCLEGRHRKCPFRWKYGNTEVSKAPGLWGGFADYVYIHPAAVGYAVPVALESIMATAAIPISNGLSWVTVAGDMRIGDTVLIAGPGQQGLGCVIAARYGGAKKTIVTGLKRDASRFEIAMQLGHNVVTVDVESEDLGTVIARETGAKGVDVAIDTTPLATRVVNELIENTRIGGRVVIAGLKRGNRAEIDTDVIASREISVIGVGAREALCIPHALGLLDQRGDELQSIRGEVYSLDDAEMAIRALGGDLGDNVPAPPHAVVVPSKK